MDTPDIIIASVFGGATLLLLVLVGVQFLQLSRLKKKVDEMAVTGRIRVQKLKVEKDKNHSFHNPAISPDEELSKRGYSMYVGPETDVESGRGSERQMGGQLVEALSKELERRQRRSTAAPPFQDLDNETRQSELKYQHERNRPESTYQDQRQQRPSTAAPPFLLQAIEENKRKSRSLNNPVAMRHSDTNANFIY